MERLQLSSNSSSAVSATNDLFDIHDDLTSVPNLFEDFKEVKTTLRVKACHTDKKLHEHDYPQLIEDEASPADNFLHSSLLFDDKSDLLSSE